MRSSGTGISFIETFLNSSTSNDVVEKTKPLSERVDEYEKKEHLTDESRLNRGDSGASRGNEKSLSLL